MRALTWRVWLPIAAGLAVCAAGLSVVLGVAWALGISLAALGGSVALATSGARPARLASLVPATLEEWLWALVWFVQGAEPSTALFLQSNLYFNSVLSVFGSAAIAAIVLLVYVLREPAATAWRFTSTRVLALAAAVALVGMVAAPILPADRVAAMWGEFVDEAAALASIVLLFTLLRDSRRAVRFAVPAYVIGTCFTILALLGTGSSDAVRFGSDAVLHPNTVGGMAGLAVLMVLAAWRSVGRWWLAPSLLLLGAGLVASFSKTALIGAGLALLAWWLLATPTAKLWRAVILAAVVAVVVGAAGQALGPYLKRYLASESGAQTLSGRTQLWAATLRVGAERPVIGYGYGLYPDVIAARAPEIQWDVNRIAHAHNAPLTVFLEQGALGVVLLLYWLGYALFLAFTLLRRHRTDPPYVLAALLLVYVVARAVTEGALAYRSDTPFLLFATLLLESIRMRPRRMPAPPSTNGT